MLLQRAFGIKPDGTVITDLSSHSEKLKKYKSVKTVDKYNDMIHVISNWGDDVILTAYQLSPVMVEKPRRTP
jgi:hypothetical protein